MAAWRDDRNDRDPAGLAGRALEVAGSTRWATHARSSDGGRIVVTLGHAIGRNFCRHESFWDAVGFVARRLTLGHRWRAPAAAVAMATALMGFMTGEGAKASSRARSHQPAVVRPRFRFVADAISIWAGRRFAVAGGPASPVVRYVTLIDDQTGQVKTISRPGCTVVLLLALEPSDLPWIPFDCNPQSGFSGPVSGPAWELYSPATGQWQSATPNPGIADSCSGPDCSYGIQAAGRYWLQFGEVTCPGGNYHACRGINVFQNFQTGELRQDPSSATTTVDLDAPNLTETPCRPLSVPTAFAPYATRPGLGSLVFYGSFALAIGTDQSLNDEVYLERCGTTLRRLVGAVTPYGAGLTAANMHEVVWLAHPGPFLSALTLPRLQPFTIRLPERLLGTSCSSPTLNDYRDCVSQIALTNHRLYLLKASPSYPEQIWVAPNPLPAQHQHG
jgi:hypothetical protein